MRKSRKWATPAIVLRVLVPLNIAPPGPSAISTEMGKLSRGTTLFAESTSATSISPGKSSPATASCGCTENVRLVARGGGGDRGATGASGALQAAQKKASVRQAHRNGVRVTSSDV